MLGRILVRRRLVTEDRASSILNRKAQEIIFPLVLWNRGEFEFIEEEIVPAQQVLISIGVDEVLMEGLRRCDTARLIRTDFPTNDVMLRRTIRPLPREIAARRFPSRLYGLVDGRLTLADIILKSHSPRLKVCRVLHAMVQRDYLAVSRPEPGQVPSQGAGRRAVREIVAIVNDLLKTDDAEAALLPIEGAGESVLGTPEVKALIQVAEHQLVERAYRHYLQPGKIPKVKMPLEGLSLRTSRRRSCSWRAA